MFIGKIKKKAEFNLVFSSGKSLKLHNMLIKYYKKSNCKNIRFAIIASKRIGNAVKRNFAKRRIRALSHIILSHGKNNFDYVIIAKKSLMNTDFKSLDYELKLGLEKIKK